MAGVQWPAVSQAAAALRVVPLHAAGAHGVLTGYLAQWPAPSQRPVVPQLAANWSVQTWAGSAAVAATGWQVPALPDTAQERQLPHGPLEQQTPSVQNVALLGAIPMALAVVLVALFGVETRGRRLEEITAAQVSHAYESS